VIGKITAEPGRGFDGYNKAADTQKKILHDVFEKGDSWFRTGDLMRRADKGYFYFVDRIGDTFRWKGENVATSEVSEVLSVIPGIQEANVYGVSVPGTDGRAGMAALVTTSLFDLAGLSASLKANLPAYSRPVFLRLLPEIETTGTFKQRKVDLVKEGFDPATVKDPLYWFDPATTTYKPLTSDAYRTIIAGNIKL
jgi:fatty-acyl-CoA synthase